MPQTVFTGSFEVCVAHFLSNIENSQKITRDFCEITGGTLRQWMTAKLPNGQRRNSLMHLMAAYSILDNDYLQLNPTCKYVGELVAFKVITSEDACQILRIKNANISHLWQVLGGYIVPHVIRNGAIKIETVKSDYDDLLSIMHEEYLQKGLILNPAEVAGPVLQNAAADTERDPPSMPATPIGEDTLLVRIAVPMLAALHPLLSELVRFDSEAGTKLRKHMGESMFYEVLDLMKSLSSREAGKFYRGTPIQPTTLGA